MILYGRMILFKGQLYVSDHQMYVKYMYFIQFQI